MRFSLRTLIIVMLVAGPVLAWAWWLVTALGIGTILPVLAGLSVLGTLLLCRNWSLKVFLAIIYYQVLGAIAGYLLWEQMFGLPFGMRGSDADLLPSLAAVIGAVAALGFYRGQLTAIAAQD